MASSWWLLTFVLFYYVQIKSAIAQYHWNCSVPDDRGERYIPGIQRGFGSPSDLLTEVVTIQATAGGSLTMYRVQNLNADCTREAVTAIEFCYQYNDTVGPGEPVFNWTVVILEETNVFTITRMIVIESHPNELDDNDCTDAGHGGRVVCCDREDISSFSFQRSDVFVFGVTESGQENTHGATLLGLHESLLEYRVNTLTISVAGQTVSVGSTIPKPQGTPRGLQLLWFVIGSTLPGTPTPTDAQTTSSLIDHKTKNIDPQTTGIPTLYGIISTDIQTTRLLIDHHRTTGVDAQATGISTSNSQDTPGIEGRKERDATAAPTAPNLISLGAVVGAVILLSAIAVLILLMACLVRKNKILKRDSGNGREIRSSMVEKMDTVDIEVDTNPSYIPLCTTENNIAYGEVALNQVGNDLYEIMDPPIEDSTTQFAQDGQSGKYTTDYVD